MLRCAHVAALIQQINRRILRERLPARSSFEQHWKEEFRDRVYSFACLHVASCSARAQDHETSHARTCFICALGHTNNSTAPHDNIGITSIGKLADPILPRPGVVSCKQMLLHCTPDKLLSIRASITGWVRILRNHRQERQEQLEPPNNSREAQMLPPPLGPMVSIVKQKGLSK